MLDFCRRPSRDASADRRAGADLGPVVADVLDRLPAAASYRVNAGALDHFCAMVGTGSYAYGMASESAGTVLSLSMLARGWTFDPARQVSFHAGLRPGEILLFNGADSGGVVLDWFRDTALGRHAIRGARGALLQSRRSADAPIFLPYLTGVNPPDYFACARGRSSASTQAHDQADLAHAVEEGIAHLLRRNIEYLAPDGDVTEIVSTGGGAASPYWNQLKADVCGSGPRATRTGSDLPRRRGAGPGRAGALGRLGDAALLNQPEFVTYRPGKTDAAARDTSCSRPISPALPGHRLKEEAREACCSSPMVPGRTLTEKAQNLRRGGMTPSRCSSRIDEWNGRGAGGTGVAREADRCPGRRVRLHGRHLRQRHGTRRRTPEPLPRDVPDAATVCAEIGAVTEIEYQYGPQDPLPLFDPFQQLSRAGRRLHRVLPASAGPRRRHTRRVLLEPINRYECRYLNRIADNIRIIDAVAHPNAGLLPDTFHMSIEEADMGKALIEAGNRIAHVHLGDSNRLLPGHGLLAGTTSSAL